MSPFSPWRRSLTRLNALTVIPSLALVFTLAVFLNARRHAVDPRLLLPPDEGVVQAVKRTSQMVKGYSVVVVTAVNNAFRDYLINLNCSLRNAKRVERLLVISLDADVHTFALQKGFESIYLPVDAELEGDEHAFGSKGFNLLSKQKLYGVYRVLQTGVDVLFVDADIVWCTDVIDEVVGLMYGEWGGVSTKRPHLLMQTAWPRSFLNSGFYYARSSEELLEAFRWFLGYDADSENDQVIVNRVLCNEEYGGEIILNGTYRHPVAPHRIMPALCRRGDVEARILGSRFPTGGEIVGGEKIFHLPRSRIMEMCGKGQVALLHNNCILSIKKRARFVVKGIWYVSEDEEMRCLEEAAPATLQMRKRCGGPKCGPEGDLTRYKDLVV